MASVSLIPEVLDLKLYGGDGVQLRLVVMDGAGQPIPLTGELAAQIRESRKTATIKASFATEITNGPGGIALITLTGADTASLHSDGTLEKFVGVWDVQWTPENEEPVTIIQGSVESNLDVTRP